MMDRGPGALPVTATCADWHTGAFWHTATVSSVTSCLDEAGSDPTLTDHDGRTILHLAAQTNTNPAVIDVMLHAGADAAALDNHGNKPATLAAENGHWPVLETLLRAEGQELLLDATPFRDVSRF